MMNVTKAPASRADVLVEGLDHSGAAASPAMSDTDERRKDTQGDAVSG